MNNVKKHDSWNPITLIIIFNKVLNLVPSINLCMLLNAASMSLMKYRGKTHSISPTYSSWHYSFMFLGNYKYICFYLFHFHYCNRLVGVITVLYVQDWKMYFNHLIIGLLLWIWSYCPWPWPSMPKWHSSSQKLANTFHHKHTGQYLQHVSIHVGDMIV